MNWKERKELVKLTFLEFFKEQSLMHGAALSYYAMLALVPILYLSMTYGGRILGNDVITNILTKLLHELIGVGDSAAIIGLLDQVDFQKGSLLLQIVGVVALLFSCSAIFNSLRISLNTFYNINDHDLGRKQVIIRNLLGRLVSMGFVMGGMVLVVVLYFAQSFFLSFGTSLLNDTETLSSAFVTIANHTLPILTNLIVFYFIFKYMHDGVVSTRIALRGSLLTSVLLHGGQLLLKFYLMHFFFAAKAGLAGSMLLVLVWVYYSSQIVFFGAKYIAVLSRMKGIPINHRD